MYSKWYPYSQPQSVFETGQATRTTQWTYFYSPTDANGQTLNLLRGRSLTRQTCVGNDCFTDSWTYKGPGFSQDTETRSGVTTTFAHTPDGNLSQVIDAVGKVLSLTEYDLGMGTPRAVDFNGVLRFTRTTTWEGWVQSQTDGRNNSTRYAYDAIGRLRTVTPPGPNDAMSYVYDNTNGTNVVEGRGTTYTRTRTFDGFGQEVATIDSLGIQSRTKYDALGQIWFRSALF